ncbi:MAG TPA: tellurite resistance/C4-dicarboxylate transporter family protein [Candidatus Acidoferrum sp.]|nr:tellurite resistance/C4-dicarboxylate transporter family protein [Candidatus Acidoferrum sp.]
MQRRNGFDGLANFFPGYFALVMATGIVSVAVHLQGRAWVALGLFWLNIVAYVGLWGITLLRIARFPRPFLDDLTHHSRGATFLTKAAGTCVLGAQFALLTPWRHVAEGLWFFGAGLSVALSYTFFTSITLCEPKPSLAAGINGAWLLVVVATESISVLGALVAPSMEAAAVVLFISLCAYAVGAMVYAFFATLILYRWMFFSMRPERLTPDYWIDMGALAITTLAGALLVQTGSRWGLLQTLAPFLTGLTICFWATATWWIPLLSALELWRHVRGKVPLAYGPDYWAMVFPLGMYAVSTFMLVRVTGLSFLHGLAEFFTYVALAAWVIVFAGMSHSLARFLRSKAGGRGVQSSIP